jgi:8-oxo-dGTP diphosphatase
MTLILVRHASAGDSAGWVGDDRLRPLDERGLAQAGNLPRLLRDLEVRRIVSSPYLRCVQTVEPLADARGLEVEPADELGPDVQAEQAPTLLGCLLGDAVVACVHGGIEAALGLDSRLKKGGVWLLERGLAAPREIGRA